VPFCRTPCAGGAPARSQPLGRATSQPGAAPIEPVSQFFCGLKRVIQTVFAPSDNTWRIYEAESLLMCWIKKSTEKFDEKLRLANLGRPAMSVIASAEPFRI
jgi:hypothetical protein